MINNCIKIFKVVKICFFIAFHLIYFENFHRKKMLFCTKVTHMEYGRNKVLSLVHITPFRDSNLYLSKPVNINAMKANRRLFHLSPQKPPNNLRVTKMPSKCSAYVNFTVEKVLTLKKKQQKQPNDQPNKNPHRSSSGKTYVIFKPEHACFIFNLSTCKSEPITNLS